MATKGEVFAALVEERQYQDLKHGGLEAHPHTLVEWITIMQRKLRDAEDGWCEGRGDNATLSDVIKATATGVACLEQHGLVKRMPGGGWVIIQSSDKESD